MKRLVLLLLLLPSLAFAQSTTGKFAVWVAQGGGSSANGGWRTTGNYDPTNPQQPWDNGGTGTALTGNSVDYALLIEMLNRMGVRYTVFTAEDSASATLGTGWGGGPSIADSTWFRSQGYIGHIFVMPDYNTSATTSRAFGRYFNNGGGAGGGNGGTWTDSPLSGTWAADTPVLVYGSNLRNISDFKCGMLTVQSASNPGRSLGAFYSSYSVDDGTMGDTLSVIVTTFSTIDTTSADSANVTRIYMNAGGANIYGHFVRIWKYKSRVLFCTAPGTGSGRGVFSMPLKLIALNEFFKMAGYKPARKIPIHLTVDHPVSGLRNYEQAANHESLFVFVRKGKWKIQAAWKVGPDERDPFFTTSVAANQSRSTLNATGQVWINSANTPYWKAHPHSHLASGTTSGPYGVYGTGSWDLTAFSDTSRMTARLNNMNRFLRDTLLVTMATSYDKSWNGPGGGIDLHQLPVLIRDGYVSARAVTGNPDSIGHRRSIAMNRQEAGIWPSNGLQRPYLYADNSTNPGRYIWIHPHTLQPGGADSTWATLTGYGGDNTTSGKIGKFMADGWAAFPFEGENAPHGEDGMTKENIIYHWAKATYQITARLDRIAEPTWAYYPSFPRRGGVARSGGTARP